MSTTREVMCPRTSFASTIYAASGTRYHRRHYYNLGPCVWHILYSQAGVRPVRGDRMQVVWRRTHPVLAGRFQKQL